MTARSFCSASRTASSARITPIRLSSSLAVELPLERAQVIWPPTSDSAGAEPWSGLKHDTHKNFTHKWAPSQAPEHGVWRGAGGVRSGGLRGWSGRWEGSVCGGGEGVWGGGGGGGGGGRGWWAGGWGGGGGGGGGG